MKSEDEFKQEFKKRLGYPELEFTPEQQRLWDREFGKFKKKAEAYLAEKQKAYEDLFKEFADEHKD